MPITPLMPTATDRNPEIFAGGCPAKLPDRDSLRAPLNVDLGSFKEDPAETARRTARLRPLSPMGVSEP